jgi:hypothetical protein
MNIKKYINNPKLILLGFIRRFAWLFPDKFYLKAYYLLIMGKKLNLNNPQTYNEKLQWLKLFDRKPEYTQMVDKATAKDYVAKIIGNEYIIPTLGVWEKFEDIDFEKLPDQFVLKTTHDSGGVVVCKDKKTFDIKSVSDKINKRLQINAFYILREWPYKNVKPRIIVEKFLANSNNEELLDYKFYCFNGEVKCVLVCSNRDAAKKNLCLDFYDMDWKRLPFKFIKYANNQISFPKPYNYELMLEFSKKLSLNIPHIRVDFYEVDGHLYFGELTFTTTSGYSDYSPNVWNYKLGSWITLQDNF